MASSSGVALARGVSDGSGRFEFSLPAGSAELLATAAGYANDAVVTPVPAAGVQLVLAPASSISGQVVSQGAEQPVAGVTVQAEDAHGRNTPNTTLTDADGHFTLPALAAGTYTLSAAAARWRSEPTSVPLGVNQSIDDLVLEVAAATTLSGQVSLNGSACAEGWVELTGPSALTGAVSAGGLVRVAGILPGAYQLEVRCPPGLPLQEELQVGNDAITRHWELAPGLTLRGVVQTPQGEGVAGIEVRVSPTQSGSTGPSAACTSDEKGQFECSGLQPGPHTCWLESLAPRGQAVAHVDLTTGEPPHVTLISNASAALRVRVTGGPGELPPLDIAAQTAGQLSVAGRPDGDGVFFERLPLGEYELSIEPLGVVRQHVRLTRPGELVEVELVQPARAALAGRVSDERGLPVVDAWVEARPESVSGTSLRGSPRTLTDDQGSFTLSGLIAGGLYTLEASTASGRVELPRLRAGQENELVLRLPTYASLSAQVATPSGEAVAAFTVSTQRRGEEGANVYECRHGLWPVTSLAPGRYRIAISSAEGGMAQDLEVAPGSNLNLKLVVTPSPGAAARSNTAMTERVD
jgi:protocatechuate 3,4-dioxygenase beta subunit